MKKVITAFVALVLGTVRAELPTGYTSVDYVESDGRQYVKTGYVPGDLTRVEATFRVVEYGGNVSIIFGSYGRTSGGGTKGQFGFAFGSSATCRFAGESASVDLGAEALDYATHTVAIDQKVFKLDGEPVFTASGMMGSEGREMLLCAYGYAKAATDVVSAQGTMSSIRLYAMKVWTGETLSLDLVPAMNAEGVAGLYDCVNDRFLTSATATPLVAAAGGVEAPMLTEFTASGTKQDGITASVKVVSEEQAHATVECYVGTDPATWEPCRSWPHAVGEAVYETTLSEVDFGSYFVAFRATYGEGGALSEVWTETNRLTFVEVKDHWLYDAEAGTLTDGLWTFTATIGEEGLTVGSWTEDGFPLDPSPLDFAKPVRDAAQNAYTIVGLDTRFGTNGGSWYTVEPTVAGQKVTELVLPEQGLVSIGAGAFGGCSSLTNIVRFLPASVQTLGAGAFAGFTSGACDLVCDVASVGSSVFKGSTALRSVTFGARTKFVGSDYHKTMTFSGCTGLTNVTFDVACTNVSLGCAFSGLRLDSLMLNGVTNVSARAFDSCQVWSLTFDRGLRFVSPGTFDDSKGRTTRLTLREVRFLGPPPESFNPEFYGPVSNPASDNVVRTYVPHAFAAAWQTYATDRVIDKRTSTFDASTLTITNDPLKRLLLWGDAAPGLILLFH